MLNLFHQKALTTEELAFRIQKLSDENLEIKERLGKLEQEVSSSRSSLSNSVVGSIPVTENLSGPLASMSSEKQPKIPRAKRKLFLEEPSDAVSTTSSKTSDTVKKVKADAPIKTGSIFSRLLDPFASLVRMDWLWGPKPSQEEEQRRAKEKERKVARDRLLQDLIKQSFLEKEQSNVLSVKTIEQSLRAYENDKSSNLRSHDGKSADERESMALNKAMQVISSELKK